MSGNWTDKFSFLTGTVRYKDLGYLALQDDSVDANVLPYSHFTEWDRGSWRDGGQVLWTTVSMSVCKHPLEQMIAVSPDGHAKLIGGGDIHEEFIQDGVENPGKYGAIRCVREIDKKAYTVGMNRQVYRRDDVNKWTFLSNSIPLDRTEVFGFESIDGFSSTDIYAVGWEGEIWHFDGQLWSKKESPTNLILTGVCCGGDQMVYACGRRGLLVRGRNDQWDVIVHGIMSEDIWSLAWFNDILWLSTMTGIYMLEGARLNPVDIGVDQAATCYHLSVADGVLWSIGKKDVMAFDGSTWVRID